MNSLSSMSILCQPSSGSFETCVAAVLSSSSLLTAALLQQLSAYKPVYFLFCNFRRVFSKQSSGSWWWKKCYVAFARKLMKPWMQRQTAGHADIWTNISSHIPWNKYFKSIKYLSKRKLNIIIFYSKPWMLFYEKFPNSFLWIHEYFCFQPFTVTIAINAMKNSYEYHFQAVIQILSASITNIKSAFYLVDFNG